jgi:light-regulated signal transduction histidine kinase (bacteriophytochrome)
MELRLSNKKLAVLIKEREIRAAELASANKELAFQNGEKGKLTAALILANQELAFQNSEKEKRAAELIIANEELLFQNAEKEKRAIELSSVIEELAFQNKEKERRTAELVTCNDVLAVRTAELLTANAELESFSYSVSHDMRAPLRAIQGFSRMLKEDYENKLDAEGNRLVNNIIGHTKKMGQLIDELLNFSRLGRKALIMVDIPMQHMVENICREFQIGDVDGRITFEINELLSVKGDSLVLKQAWTNIISNAIKYSRLKENAIIEIGSSEKGREIIYYVKDNGAGFDMRFANKLFGVFQRLHSEEQFEGTGVGLAIVHRIISKHGGKVWAEGKVNEGATFYFSLPKHSS